MENYLVAPSDCIYFICPGNCGHDLKINPETNRWFITVGHPGFNSFQNNRDGYKYKWQAQKEIETLALRRK